MLPVFQMMAEEGKLETYESHQVFNMGIGMTIVVSPADAEKILKTTKSYLIGRIVKGNGKVKLV